MMLIHFRRIWSDRRLLICLVVAFFISIILAKPQILSIEQVRSMELADMQTRFGLAALQTKDELIHWYTMHIYLPEVIGGNSTAIIIAAVLASYMIGGCLSKPIISEQYAGTPRILIALRLYFTVIVSGFFLSLILLTSTLVIYARSCLQLFILGISALTKMLCMRLFFDIANYSLMSLCAFITRESNISFCIGAVLAILTTVMQLMKKELWWLPNYALQYICKSSFFSYNHMFPSLVILLLSPFVGILVLHKVEIK